MNKSSQSKCFFAALSLPCKSRKTWAAIFLLCCRYALSLCPSVKICYALQLRTRPPSFCLLSPEAVLLTGKEETILVYQF